MKRAFISLIIILALVQYSIGQNFNITGKIVDKATSSPIEFANVTLMSKDSTFIKGINSDANGLFAFNSSVKSYYLLSVAYLGYETSYLEIDDPIAKGNIGDIGLEPSSIALKEAVITAQSIINKSDRKLITPSDTQVKASSNGFDLLQKLQLSRIKVDPINNKITAMGNGEVQLRINGLEVTQAEVIALRPDEIVRIEYHDDPGVRYLGAAAVIDYITRRKQSGGNVNGDLVNGISKLGFSEDNLAAKFNHKKSEFSANTYWHYRKIDWTRHNEERYIYPDKEVDRIEEGLPTMFKEHYVNTSINYSLLEKDKYMFNVRFRYNFTDRPNSYSNRESTLQTSDSPTPLHIYDYSSDKSNTPSLDLYYQHNLKNDQLLIFNVVGTYITSHNRRSYEAIAQERYPVNILSNVDGEKYSLIVEGIYERKQGEGKLTGGLKHKQNYTNNVYAGTTQAEFSMKQAESYAYAEYQIKKGKFSYMANLTGTRFYYSQVDESEEKYMLQPSARITYNPNDNTYFRYKFNLWGHTPSLSDLSDLEQAIDEIQVRRGNPYLRPNKSYNNELSGGYNKGMFGLEFYANYTYRNKPVMESIFLENDKFVRTTENHKGMHHLTAQVTFKLKPWKEYINISVSPGVNRYISQGNNYTHTYTNKFIRVNVDGMYKNWVLNFWGGTSWDWFYGETMNEGEQMHSLMVGYNKPNYSIMVGAFNPFGGDYKTRSETWSDVAPSKSFLFTDNLKQVLVVKVTFNVNFGRQFKADERRLNNADNDSGIMSGSK